MRLPSPFARLTHRAAEVTSVDRNGRRRPRLRQRHQAEVDVGVGRQRGALDPRPGAARIAPRTSRLSI